MSTTTRYEEVPIGTGERFDAYCAAPDGESPGVILFQEFLGVNDNMRSLAERLANVG